MLLHFLRVQLCAEVQELHLSLTWMEAAKVRTKRTYFFGWGTILYLLLELDASHCTWQVVLPEKFCAKQMVLKNVIRTYWGMQKSKMQNHIMCPLRGLVQHRPKNPPNLGRMGCLCQLLSPKGHMIWFLFFQYTFPVAKWVRKYPPCALHKTFLVRCLRKYSV